MIPSPADAQLSRELLSKLRSVKDLGKTKIEIEMDSELRDALAVFAEKYASGQPLYIVEETKEYTTNEAAEVLRVSRTYLNKLLDQNKIPYRTVGTHKRIEARDLFRYKAESDKKSDEALRQHALIAREFADE